MINGEKYKKEIKELNYDFALINNELKNCTEVGCCDCQFNYGSLGCKRNVIGWLLEEYKEPIKPILTKKEKIIINNILKAVEPFGAEVQCIAKYRQGDEPTDYYLNFSYKNSTDSFDTFTFNGNELFVGMEVDELYTLEDLGL